MVNLGDTHFRFEQVELDLLAPDPNQVRKHFDEESLKSLSDSIKANGLVQPIVTRPKADGGLEIVAGERRWRAATMAGIEKVPTIVREDLAGKDLTVLQVLENLQREDLTLAETCAGVARLVEEIGFAKACEQLGKSEAWVSKHASVMKLPDAVKQLVSAGKIESVDVAKDLGTLIILAPKKAENLLQRIDPTARLYPSSPGAEDEEDEDLDDQDGDDEVYYQGKYYKRDELTPEQLEHAQLRYARYARPPTRNEIRFEVLDAKAKVEEKHQKKIAAQAERARISADPKLQKQADRERAKKDAEREKQKGLRERITAAIEFIGKFEEEATQVLAKLGGFKAPKKTSYGFERDTPIRVEGPHIYQGQTREPPASAAAAHYQVHCFGTFEQIAICAKLLQPEPKLQMQLDSSTLTIVEAKKIAEIFGGRAKFRFDVQYTGAKLNAVWRALSEKDEPAWKSKADTDPIARFLSERTRKATPAHKIKSSDLHAAFLAWCKTNKVKDPAALRSNQWGAAIAAAGIEKMRSDGMQYIGIKLIDQE